MRFVVGLLAFALLASGCGPRPQAMKPPHKIYASVVSLSPSATELIAVHSMMARLTGRTESCNYPQGLDHIAVVTKGAKPDYEKIASIKPGLIVYDPILYNEADVAKLKELGIELFPLEAHSIAEYIKSVSALGGKLQAENSVSTYIDKVLAARQTALANAPKPSPKAAVIMPGGGTEHMIAGVDSFQADVLRAVGATPVGPKSDRFVVLNAESLVAENPDVIFVAGDASSVIGDPRLQSIKAVKNHKVRGVLQDVLLRTGNRVDALISSLSKAL